MKTPLLQLVAVGYAQQKLTILQDVSWTVEHGRHWAVLGPNGSGKTTLLKVAAGYLWPTSGRVLREGVANYDLGAFRKQIGWISADMLSQVPVAERAVETVISGKFAQFGLKYLQSTTPTSSDFTQARRELERSGCAKLADRPFGALSQGERQQVLVARTRMAGPTLLVLDEPCAGMDPGVRERYLAWLAGRLTEPTFPTTILVTHHVEEVIPGLDQALIVVGGRIAQAGSTDETLSQANLEAAYQLPIARFLRHGGRRWPVWDATDHSAP